MRYFIELSFWGKKFAGWQIQPNAPTLQSCIEKVLSTYQCEPISIVGSGRTDSGVHAKRYYIHFDTTKLINDEDLHHINCMLPFDIALHRHFLVNDKAHARFDAISRRYNYFITTRKNPLVLDRAWFYPYQLDLELMNKGCQLLLATTDFTSFCKLHSDAKTNICHLKSCEVFLQDGLVVLNIEADRFLRNMVRAIAGTLAALGRNKITLEAFQTIINNKSRSSASTSAPAHGLFFIDAIYDFKSLEL